MGDYCTSILGVYLKKNMLLYYFVFFILFICVVLSNNSDRKIRKHIEIFASTLIICFQGLRWENGTDWPVYMQMFNDYAILDIDYYHEPCWFLLNKLFNNLTGSYTSFLLFQSIFIQYCTIKFSDDMGIENKTIMIMSSLTSCIFPVRANLAMGFIMLSYKPIIDRRLLRFILYVILATTIHWVSFVFLPFYFVIRKRISAVKVMTIYFLFCILGFATSFVTSNIQSTVGVLGPLFSMQMMEKIEGYAEGGPAEYLQDWTPTYYALALLRGAIFLYLYLWIRKKFFDNSNIYNVLLNLYLIGLCIVRTFSQAIPYLARVGNFATLGGSILILMAISKCNKQTRLFWLVVYSLYCFISYYTILHGQFRSLFIPYRLVLFQ